MGFRSEGRGIARPRRFERQRILLVEDTRLYSIAVRDRLENSFGLDVTHCATYAALAETLAAGDNGYKLAILDLCLADAPNGEALDLIQAHGIVPIVFSGVTSDARRAQILSRNVADLVYKSSERSIDNLATAVDTVLSQGRPHIIIVSSGNSRSIAALVSSAQFVIDECADTDAAFALLDCSRNIEIVVMDADQAGRDDYSAIHTLKARYGDDAVSVVGYSSLQAEDDEAKFLAAGGDDFIRLPASAPNVASRLTHALSTRRRIQDLRRMASRDYLTDLLNRRYFFDRGPKLVDQCLRQNAPACAALLDIDHFKRLNDTYGHEVGDLVLKAVAKKLRALVGEQAHLPARIGGEEFAILFCNLSIGDAYEFCEKIRAAIADTRIVIDDEELSVTVSMGLASISEAETFDNYLNAADQYLYLAKHSGRNRIFSDHQIAKMGAA